MNSKKWIRLFFLIVLILGVVPYIFSNIYLKSNFENNTYAEIVKRQLEFDSIYGTALNQNTYSYKMELVKHVKPDIITLGSSRVMQFRKESFSKSFVNTGGAMNHLTEGLKFLKEMYQFHSPKLIILGLDFWWFNDQVFQPVNFEYHTNSGDIMTFRKVIKPYHFFINNKNDVKTIGNIFDNKFINNKITNHDSLGFDAISFSNGFRSDGSRLYGSLVFGVSKSHDKKFQNTIKRIKKKDNRFQQANNISKERLKVLNEIIEFVKLNNTKLVIFVPPVAKTINKILDNENYKHIEKLIKEYQKFNYHDYSILNSSECEFTDGFHGGDVLYNRIIFDIYEKDDSLKKFVNLNNVQFSIENFHGKTLTKYNLEKYHLNEVDFLKMGCNK
jgi:hypothetical protein